jgi:ABC-type transport system substrate-binding protein
VTESRYWARAAMSRRSMIRGGAVGVAGLAGAALIGCGGGSEGGATGTPVGTASTGTPTAIASTKTAKKGGTIRISGQLTGDVPGLDYDRTGGSAMGSISNLAGVKLTQWDERPDSPGPVENVIPDLAESWETPDKGLTWNFKLKKGVKTSDGLEVKASDVVWTLDRQAAIRTPTGYLQTNLRDLYTGKKPNATAIDDYTLQLKLNNPDADFLALMGSHWWAVEHKDVITKKGADEGKSAPGYGDIKGVDQIRGGAAVGPAGRLRSADPVLDAAGPGAPEVREAAGRLAALHGLEPVDLRHDAGAVHRRPRPLRARAGGRPRRLDQEPVRGE